MEKCELQPVEPSALPDVADFLARWRASELSRQRIAESVSSIEQRLKWLLLENPVAREGFGFGFCLRDQGGIIRGLNLAYPAGFVRGGRRLLGLGSGSFFVEPSARSLGFYLFKKYLGIPGYSFFFATTCNENSAPLWERLGGHAVPGSEVEYILPLKLDVVMPAIIAGRTTSKSAYQAARICGRGLNPVLRLLTRPARKLKIEPCQDWEKLAELSRRNGSSEYLESDRSVDFLKWRYEPPSPLFPSRIYLFRDEQGNEGWFSLANLIRGEEDQLRGSVLLDAVWPREKMSFDGIFREILHLSSDEADAIFLRSQPRLNYREFNRCVIRYRRGTPRAVVMTRKGAASIAPETFHYDDSDYGAWRFQWRESNAPAEQDARVGSDLKWKEDREPAFRDGV